MSRSEEIPIRPGETAWAVVDPTSQLAASWHRAFGTDAIVVFRRMTAKCQFAVDLDRLNSTQVLRLCREIADGDRRAYEHAVWEAYHGIGLGVPACAVFLGPDPETGRAFFASKPGGRPDA
jgi:hypothetical protein